MIDNIQTLLMRVSMEVMGITFRIRVERDNKDQVAGRIFLQVVYYAPCTKTGELLKWHGRKWYLSDHMTDDEIIKTAYAAFEAAVKHEVMEGFKVDGKILFNPHVSYEALLSVSDIETQRA